MQKIWGIKFIKLRVCFGSSFLSYQEYTPTKSDTFTEGGAPVALYAQIIDVQRNLTSINKSHITTLACQWTFYIKLIV